MKATKKADLAHPHDLLVRNILSDPELAADLFKNYLPPEWVSLVDFDSLRRETNESVGRNLSELVGDLRYSAKFRKGDGELRVFVLLEHQSRPDRFMSFRLLEYVCAAYRQHLSTVGKKKGGTFPFPLAVVLHHGKTPWRKLLPMGDLIDSTPGVATDFFRFPICLIDLARIPADELHGHPVVCALLDSLQSASTGQLSNRAGVIFGRLRGIGDDGRVKLWAMALARYYAVIQRRIHGSVEDLTSVFTRFSNRTEASKMAGTIAEELRQEGRTEGQIQSVIDVLETRFGRVPAGLKKKLAALNDSKRVAAALKLAVVCPNLKDFEKTL